MLFLDGLDKNVEFGASFKQNEMCLDKDTVFVNHGSYGTVPKRIADAQRRYREEMDSNPDKWFRQVAFQYWTKAVTVVSKFLHCSAEDLVLVPNATTGINSVIRSCKLQPGDAILTNKLTYGAVQRTVDHFTKTLEGCEAIFLDIKFPISSAQEIVNQFEEYFKSHRNIKLAVIDYITSPASVLMPVKEIIDLCRQYHVLSVIDGAHAPGQVPLHLDDLNADFFTGNLHKWLYAPRGCAVLWVNRNHRDWLLPVVTSWGHGLSLHNQFFKQGTRDHTAEICSMHGIQFYEAIGNMERIVDYTSNLVSEAQKYLVRLLGSQPLPIPPDMQAPNMRCILLSGKHGFADSVESKECDDLIVDVINETKVVCMFVAIQGQMYLRISANVYNTMGDYKRLGEVLLAWNTSKRQKTE